MNRRTFFSSILGVPAALAAAAAHAARPEGKLVMLECEGGHTAAQGYTSSGYAVFALHTPADGMRQVIPCARCGVMFALKR